MRRSTDKKMIHPASRVERFHGDKRRLFTMRRDVHCRPVVVSGVGVACPVPVRGRMSDGVAKVNRRKRL
jgi:hypothetical protein